MALEQLAKNQAAGTQPEGNEFATTLSALVSGLLLTEASKTQPNQS